MVEGEEQEKEQREEKDQQQRGEKWMKLLCICRAVSGDRNGIIPNLHV